MVNKIIIVIFNFLFYGGSSVFLEQLPISRKYVYGTIKWVYVLKMYVFGVMRSGDTQHKY